MGQTTDVSMDTVSVYYAAEKFEALGASQSGEVSSLSEVNNDLYTTWKGDAGDKFKLAGDMVEKMLVDLAKKNRKYYGALVDLTKQFETLDTELANNCNANVKSASKGGAI